MERRRRARRLEGLCDLLALAPDGRTAVAGKAGRPLEVIDVTAAKKLRTLGDGNWYAVAAFAPDGKTVAVTVDYDIRVWE